MSKAHHHQILDRQRHNDHDDGGRGASQKAMLLVVLLLAVYLVVELIGGLWANSLALLADAGHMFTDIAALLMSVVAMWLAGRPPTARRSFGFHRLEILAALMNSSLLIVLTGGLLFEAARRIQHPSTVVGIKLMAIAMGGLVVNGFGAWILARGHREGLNSRGALLHVLSDAAGSFGSVVAGFLIWRFGWNLADPVVSALIAVLILRSAWGLVVESVDILLQNTPAHLDPAEIVHSIESLPGVLNSHDLHIWTLTSGMVSLTCHVEVVDESACMTILQEIKALLLERFRIDHATLQLESAGQADCGRLNW